MREVRLRTLRAFTVLELLVAISVLVLLLVLLAGIVDQAAHLWTEKQSRADVSREERAAVQVISNDMRTVLRSSDVDAIHLPAGASERLALLTLQPGRAQPSGNRSDLCTVGYFVAYDRPSRFSPLAHRSRNLYRYLRGSDETFAALQAGQDLFAEFDTVAAMDEPSRSGNVTLLARNVNRVRFSGFAFSPTGEPEPAGTRKPAAIEVGISLVPKVLAARLADEGAWLSVPEDQEISSSTLLPLPSLP